MIWWRPSAIKQTTTKRGEEDQERGQEHSEEINYRGKKEAEIPPHIRIEFTWLDII